MREEMTCLCGNTIPAENDGCSCGHSREYIRKKRGDDRPDDLKPDWSGECMVCGSSPVMPATGMCGPCTTGDASTVAGW